MTYEEALKVNQGTFPSNYSVTCRCDDFFADLLAIVIGAVLAAVAITAILFAVPEDFRTQLTKLINHT